MKNIVILCVLWLAVTSIMAQTITASHYWTDVLNEEQNINAEFESARIYYPKDSFENCFTIVLSSELFTIRTEIEDDDEKPNHPLQDYEIFITSKNNPKQRIYIAKDTDAGPNEIRINNTFVACIQKQQDNTYENVEASRLNLIALTSVINAITKIENELRKVSPHQSQKGVKQNFKKRVRSQMLDVIMTQPFESFFK